MLLAAVKLTFKNRERNQKNRLGVDEFTLLADLLRMFSSIHFLEGELPTQMKGMLTSRESISLFNS